MEKIWLKHYEPGVPESVEYPQISLFKMLEDSASRFGALPAVSFMGRVITYNEFLTLTKEFAAALESLGVKKGDRVAIHLPNCTQFPIAFYGVLALGAVAVPCNPMYVARELIYQLNDSQTETIITLTRFYKMIKDLQPQTGLKNIIVTNIKDYFPGMLRFLYTVAKEKKEGDRVKVEAGDYNFLDLIKKHKGKKPKPVEVFPEDRAVFMYTGGSTGVSKGAVLQHRNLLANAIQLKAWCTDLKEGKEAFLAVLPYFHSYGMTTALNLPVLTGNKMILLPRFVLADVLKTIDKEKPTLFPGVPTMYVAINNAPDLQKHNVRSIRVCNSGAAPLPVEVQQQFEKITGGKLVEGYGLSESSPVTHSNPIYGKNKVGSIGLPIVDTEMKIVDLETGETELPIGEIGELCVRGPQVMEGYLNMPEETAHSLRDGWLYTGDIARVDEEGYTYIVDRKKDMVIAGGYNIYPRDIEEVLYTHPKILEAAVAGISDPYRGETLKAYIVLKEGETLTEEEVIAFCKENLAAYKVPKLVEFRSELPKTMVGKILRRVLREEELKKVSTEKK
ncbi:MAG TPA: long-chain fatty acid--CoA ligase [Bacillota bacterium]|nr:long-chain fatty acid--CoA ligase [Bacillota bacterium]HOA36066.1 long-chain fatty acid--CoA ligase [Bacillota bacterium]HPZ11453.1 long-chain fatty acid--CoA ligase [Bacillota bacterium]HQE10436.1 long-chain fatty acid--CoA ligase [Bacillota bacterium]